MSIPDPVLHAIQAQSSFDLFPVTGTETYSAPILKANILQFDSGAVLQLKVLAVPYLVICARQVLLLAPSPGAVITRDPSFLTQPGVPGTSGAAGTSGVAHSENGMDGSAASGGTPGNTMALPKVYFFTEKIVVQPNSPAAWTNLSFFLVGFDGGVGGAGGNGGNGADLVLAGPQTALEQMSFIKIANGGGHGGAGGKGGHGGVGGRGGAAGSSPMGPQGRQGLDGSMGRSGIDGSAGISGNKGTVTLVVQASLDNLFA